jgi:hypothetical protein
VVVRVALGFIVQGDTLTVPGMLFINRCTWAPIADESTRLLNLLHEELLTAEEVVALDGPISPEKVILQYISNDSIKYAIILRAVIRTRIRRFIPSLFYPLF